MPLRMADLRTVTVKEQAPTGVCAMDERPVFRAEGQRVRAILQPLQGDVERTLYGERATKMLTMLCQNGLALREGMGVCVEGQNGACDYRIAAPPQRWRGHMRLTLERL